MFTLDSSSSASEVDEEEPQQPETQQTNPIDIEEQQWQQQLGGSLEVTSLFGLSGLIPNPTKG